jgi:hypothetical protein
VELVGGAQLALKQLILDSLASPTGPETYAQIFADESFRMYLIWNRVIGECEVTHNSSYNHIKEPLIHKYK